VTSQRRQFGTPPRLARDGSASWRPGRLASVVVEELAHRIIGGALATGDVLPTEPLLCEEFGFSRTVIREALKLLEERGLVRVEQGRGTSVQPRASWNFLDPVVIRIALEYDGDMTLLESLITVRIVLEREMARAAAVQLTPEQLEALADNIEQMEGAYDDYERFRVFDQAFHSIVMDASGNEVGRTIVRAIHQHGDARPLLARSTSRKLLTRTVSDHRAVYEALAARDGQGAAELIERHIANAWTQRKGERMRS
jgi:DNA-binding FadR family transcriptional regulator